MDSAAAAAPAPGNSPVSPSSTESPATPPAALASKTAEAGPVPITGYDKVAWTLLGVTILFMFHVHLLPALLAGLGAHALIRGLGARIAGKRFSHGTSKVIAASIIGVVLVSILTAVVVLGAAYMSGKLGNKGEDYKGLLEKMAEGIESTKTMAGLTKVDAEGNPLAMDADQLRDKITEGLRDHAKELQEAGMEYAHIFFHVLIGLIIGTLVAFRERKGYGGPLGQALGTRVNLLAESFEKIVNAQMKISGLNAILTAIFLFVILPALGFHLPLRKTMVVVTFLVGMMPILGNVVSNTIIFIVALGVSAQAAIFALIFLIVVHKLEYFVNARIVGGEIKASAWEVLLAMFVFEAAFGIPGVVFAPIFYTYIKREFTDLRLI